MLQKRMEKVAKSIFRSPTKENERIQAVSLQTKNKLR